MHKQSGKSFCFNLKDSNFFPLVYLLMIFHVIGTNTSYQGRKNKPIYWQTSTEAPFNKNFYSRPMQCFVFGERNELGFLKEWFPWFSVSLKISSQTIFLPNEKGAAIYRDVCVANSKQSKTGGQIHTIGTSAASELQNETPKDLSGSVHLVLVILHSSEAFLSCIWAPVVKILTSHIPSSSQCSYS